MSIQYTGSGGIKIGGCADYSYKICYQLKFGINTPAWIKASALKGCLEKVIIKKVKMIEPYHFLYIDTFNAIYNEDELLTYQDAVDLKTECVKSTAMTTPVVPVDTSGAEFKVGDSLWLKTKALKGILEKVVIKKIKGDKYNFLYVDTFNAFYNENDLITYQDASNLAKEYWEQQKFLVIKAIKSC